jgi:hypothetical protein
MKRCNTPNCVRILGHTGAHTAAPSGAALDWDHKQAEQRYNDQTLMALDFPTPYWAVVNDPFDAEDTA